jgi:hypothetical protein
MDWVGFEPTASAVGCYFFFDSSGQFYDVKNSCLLRSKLFASTLFVIVPLNDSEGMQKEVIEKVAALITAAFGLVAALAWN